MFERLNRTDLTTKGERASARIFLSEWMCSSCRLSTTCFFLMIFNAKVTSCSLTFTCELRGDRQTDRQTHKIAALFSMYLSRLFLYFPHFHCQSVNVNIFYWHLKLVGRVEELSLLALNGSVNFPPSQVGEVRGYLAECQHCRYCRFKLASWRVFQWFQWIWMFWGICVCNWVSPRSHQLDTSKAADPERCNDLQLVKGPGGGERGHQLFQPDDVWWQRLALVARHWPLPGQWWWHRPKKKKCESYVLFYLFVQHSKETLKPGRQLSFAALWLPGVSLFVVPVKSRHVTL